MPCSHGAEEMFVILPASEPDMEFLQLVWRLVSAPSALCVTPSTEHRVSTEQWGKSEVIWSMLKLKYYHILKTSRLLRACSRQLSAKLLYLLLLDQPVGWNNLYDCWREVFQNKGHVDKMLTILSLFEDTNLKSCLQ